MKTVLKLLIVLSSNWLFGQQRMMVFFDGKNVENQTPINLSDRAIIRRYNQNITEDNFDLPVDQTYLNALKEHGEIIAVSRWLNGVVFETNLSLEQVQSQFSFVQEIRSVGPTPKPQVEEITQKSFDYGLAFDQVNQINSDCLHALDYAGAGVYLAVIDAGFSRMDSIDYFAKVYSENRVLDTKNFVHLGNSVYTSSGHGTMVASCIVGEKEGASPYVGTGVDVDLALYLTEDVSSETEIEEFYLVSALERCDSLGVDVVNISLGYFGFDDSTTNHTFADLDGTTTIAAIGINIAASKGIAVVTSAGNSGPSYITTPCDADGVLCVGAVDEFGNRAPFSSIGPSSDGQTKPDVSARGAGSQVIEFNTGTILSGNGTSFASPIMCGAVACLRQAHPTASVENLFEIIRASSSQADNPDNLIGYGLPDFCLAHVKLSEQEFEKELFIYPNPADAQLVIESNSQSKEMQLIDVLGNCVWNHENASLITYISTQNLAAGTYFLMVSGAQDLIQKVVILHE